MRKPAYTSIPDTSDSHYWQTSEINSKERFTRFVPIDPELHRQLKQKAWSATQARLSRKQGINSLGKQRPVKALADRPHHSPIPCAKAGNC